MTTVTAVMERVRRHDVSLVAAGVAFFALFALVPALAAFVSIVGLIADPADVGRQVDDLMSAAPAEVRDFVSQQLIDLARAPAASLTISAIIGLGVALWSASAAAQRVVRAVGIAYGVEVRAGVRTIVSTKAKAIGITLGAILFLALLLWLSAFVPVTVRPLGAGARATLELLRWPVLVIVLVYGFSLLYRVGAKRPVAWRFGIARGAIAAGVAFIPVSLGLAFYTSRIASLNETYGSLAGLIVMMLWLYAGAWIIVLGAELDAVLSDAPTDTTVVPSVEGD